MKGSAEVYPIWWCFGVHDGDLDVWVISVCCFLVCVYCQAGVAQRLGGSAGALLMYGTFSRDTLGNLYEKHWWQRRYACYRWLYLERRAACRSAVTGWRRHAVAGSMLSSPVAEVPAFTSYCLHCTNDTELGSNRQAWRPARTACPDEANHIELQASASRMT